MNNHKRNDCNSIVNSIFNSETFAASFFGLFIFTQLVVQGVR